MKKFFYALGVYTFCVWLRNVFHNLGSDEFWDNLNEKMERIKSDEKKKEENCKGAVVAKVVRNRIGF